MQKQSKEQDQNVEYPPGLPKSFRLSKTLGLSSMNYATVILQNLHKTNLHVSYY